MKFKKLSWLALFIFSISFISCSLNQPLNLSFKKLPNKFKNAKINKAIELEPTQYWWKKFNDSMLNELMDKAFSSNLDLKAAFYRLEEAEAQIQKANSTLWPKINLQTKAGKTTIANKSTSLYDFSFEASYEIDIFQRLKAYRDEKQLELAATKEDIKGILLTLSAQVANTYYKILEYKEKIRIQQLIIKELERTFKLVKLRYENGLVSSLDVYQAHQNLIANKAVIPKMESVLEASKNSLAVLLGDPPSEKLFEKIEKKTLPKKIFSFREGLPSELIKNRPDIQASYLRLLAQNKKVAQALADLFPRFNLLGLYGGSNVEPAHLFDYKNAFWNVFLGITQPIFRGGALRAELKRKKAILKKLAMHYQLTILQAFKEVEDTLFLQNSIESSLALLEEQLKDLKASVRLSLLRYKLGLSDFLPVLQAQTSFQSVIQEIISKRYELISTRIQLARVLGGKWMEEELKKLRKKSEKSATKND